MSLVESRKYTQADRARDTYVEDPDEALTLLYTPRSGPSHAMRAAPLDDRGGSPATADTASIARMLRELRAMIPPVDASRPITSLGDPVPTTWGARDAPSPSARTAAVKGAAKIPVRRSAKPRENVSAKTSRTRLRRKAIFGFVTAAAIGIGLWHDDVGRSDLSDELGRMANAIGGFVLEILAGEP